MATPIELLRQKLAQQRSATSSAYRTPQATTAPTSSKASSVMQNTTGATRGPSHHGDWRVSCTAPSVQYGGIRRAYG